MKEDNTIIGVLIEETTTISFQEVCHKYRIPEALLHEMVEHGLFSTKTTTKELITLSPKDLLKIESAFRLHRDLRINLPGVALALELLEKIDRMNDELTILRRQF